MLAGSTPVTPPAGGNSVMPEIGAVDVMTMAPAAWPSIVTAGLEPIGRREWLRLAQRLAGRIQRLDESRIVAASFDDEDRRYRDREFDRDGLRLIQAGIRAEIEVVGMGGRMVRVLLEIRRGRAQDQRADVDPIDRLDRAVVARRLDAGGRANRNRDGRRRRAGSGQQPDVIHVEDALAAAVDADGQLRDLLQVRAHRGESDIPLGPRRRPSGRRHRRCRRPSRR